tara:strand:+ start:487 stop:858 length:372 start_codon:yes stop_codon:yes gene_type:complete
MSYLKNYQGFIKILESAGVSSSIIDALKEAVAKSVDMDSAISGTEALKNWCKDNMETLKDMVTSTEGIEEIVSALEPWYSAYIQDLEQEETGTKFADEMRDEDDPNQEDSGDDWDGDESLFDM